MGKVTILGCDPGTANMGYSLIECGPKLVDIHLKKQFGVLKTYKRRNGVEVPIRQRIDELGETFTELIQQLKPDYIAIEDFVEQGKRVGKTYKDMSYLTEHLRMVTKGLGCEASIYANGYWKKQTLKIMRANKLQVQHYVTHKVPEASSYLKGQPDHVWDSVGIAVCKWLEIATK